ncbi:MAG: hypothetical protein ACYC35_09190 [Pirellulales bacterium]
MIPSHVAILTQVLRLVLVLLTTVALAGSLVFAAELAGPRPLPLPLPFPRDSGEAASGLPAEEKPAWATGQAFRNQLTQPVGISWTGVGLRKGLATVSRTQRVAILIDRRVDPDRKLDQSQSDVPLGQLLETIAGGQGAGVAVLDSVVYLGPPATADRLPALLALQRTQLRRLPPGVQQIYLRSRRWGWGDLATPRELLLELGKEGGIDIQGLDRIPHDLWAGADLPALPLLDRLALVAVQFDLVCRLSTDGKTVRLAPLSDEPIVSAKAGVTPASQTRTPDPVPKGKGTKVYTLSVKEVSLSRLLEELKRKLSLDIRYDEAGIRQAGRSLDALVTVEVKNATLDQLLGAALEPAGLTFRRQGTVVEIGPRK